ncbi:hypothetical protein CAPTEDRAFT_209823 [Capitella teleta]|uniref:Sec20 C-terminal domain-containing protein n=1 Tax=Capitella teleta TaxID=283909 RepID=R7T416_CAPTE|nr:hypothetical protein CAPTEDRAFT_209823 [Capitella teleta]|eukprot:ELT87617.1 hypothetical protein CAPTEDRAFT_209823 [Capitella teleta]
MASDDVLVRSCRQEIVKLDLKIKAKIQDITECKGPLDVLQNLNREVNFLVEDAKSKIEELINLAKELDKETDRILLTEEANNHSEQLHRSLLCIRKANIQSKSTIEKLTKEALTSGQVNPELRARRTKESMAKTANQITENMMSISRTLANEVQLGQHTVNNLVTSSSQVSETHEEFKNMSGHIHNSKKLLTKYDRRKSTNKWLIVLAMIFFFATVLYVVKKRLFSSNAAVVLQTNSIPGKTDL